MFKGELALIVMMVEVILADGEDFAAQRQAAFQCAYRDDWADLMTMGAAWHYALVAMDLAESIVRRPEVSLVAPGVAPASVT